MMTKKKGSLRHTLISIQLKATAQQLVEDDIGFSFPLPIKNFNDLRMESSIPSMLCVLRLPADEKDWLAHSLKELILRHCMFWYNVKMCPPTTNLATVTIHIPWANRLTPDRIFSLMQKAAETRTI